MAPVFFRNQVVPPENLIFSVIIRHFSLLSQN
jgi:hypothetical protein